MGVELRFVVQRHERAADPHFDIMLEHAGSLRTWSAREAPEMGGEQEVRSLPDHRVDYLTYEGEISGGRGTVTIWDRGTYRPLVWEERRVEADLSGHRLRGRILLSHIESDRWHLEIK